MKRIKGYYDMPHGWAKQNDYNNKVYELWRKMIRRTTENYWEHYPYYKGTTVSDDWLYLSNFVNDIKELPNYDKWKETKGKYFLDKDVLGNGRKHYSKETCCFLSAKDSTLDVLNRHKEIFYTEANNKARQKIAEEYGKKILITNINTKEEMVFQSIKECARFFNVYPSTISYYLKRNEDIHFNTGRKKSYFMKIYKIEEIKHGT